jgi:hypothetical protein
MEVISSYNLFVDSDNSLSGKGDEFTVQVASAGVNCGDGQFIRISLESFNMYKSFYNVNINNSEFYVRDITEPVPILASIDNKNYKTIGDMAGNWAEKTRQALQTLTGISTTLTSATPAIEDEMDATSDRIVSARFTFNTAHPYTTGNKVGGGNASVDGDLIVFPKIQCYEDRGDSHALLGADRIQNDTDITTNSMIAIWHSPTVIEIKGKYPGQRSTEEHVYLRCDLPNNNIETGSLSSSKADHSSHIVSSDILGKMIIDHEFINYTSSTGREFFLNIPNRNINTMRFYLRDSKDRPIGRRTGNTSAGTGTAQNTLGNLNCSFVLKIEIVQAYRPNKLITEPPAPTVNPKKVGVLNNMNFGVGAY